MGLSDRDYARQPPPGGPLRGSPLDFRRFSFNTWLIIINVVVFMLGMAAPPVLQDMGVAGDPQAQVTGHRVAQPQQSLIFANARAEHWVDDNGRVIFERIGPTDGKGNLAVPSRSGPGWTAQQLYRLDYALRPDGVMEVTPVWLRETRFMPMRWTDKWGHFSTARAFFGLEVWRFVTFQFLHADLSHLLLNMIGLYFFGPLVESYLGSRKRYAAYYLTCGIFGALLYLILNLLGWVANSQFNASIPGLLFNDPHMPLIGASAGVFGVLMASAFIAGNQKMYAFMVIPMKISTGAYLLTAGALFNLIVNGQNAGGDAAHVGGAIAGFYFIRNMHLLNDFFDVLGPGRGAPSRRPHTPKDDRRLDAILRKVSEEGVGSLSRRERRYLESHSDDKGRTP